MSGFVKIHRPTNIINKLLPMPEIAGRLLQAIYSHLAPTRVPVLPL